MAIKNKLLICFLSIFIFSIAHAEGQLQTKYPIVLIHGLFGFGKEISFFARYWGEIPQMLRNLGITVYEARVSPAHHAKKRGEQLYRQLIEWGHEKYNLIGHSHGGLDARYVMEVYPELVSSVTTIATPNHGSKVADYLANQITRHRLTKAFLRVSGNFLGHFISTMSGDLYPQDTLAALQGLTTEALTEFNRQFPKGVNEYCVATQSLYGDQRLYSWGSVGVEANSFDFVTQFFTLTSKLFAGEKNDGLVSLCSMKFGKWLGALEGAHHLVPVDGVISYINQEQHYWALNMFLTHVRRLKNKGM
jgi:triacylglycerol lipase